MLTYVADVFGHTLVVLFLFADKKYNGGSFFVKRESIRYKSVAGYYCKQTSQFI